MSIETLYKPYDSGLYTLKYYLVDDVKENMGVFGPLSASYSSLYEHLDWYIKQAFRSTCGGDKDEL